MKKTQIKSALCATGLAFAATSSFAQAPFTPVVPVPRATTVTTTTTPIVVRLAEGARVIDIAGAPVGRIENIVMSPVGCAEAALVASSAGRIIPVPWTLIRSSEPATAVGVTPGVATFTVNVEEARFVQAPSFTRAQLPDMTTTTWLQPSVAFFNVSSSTATSAAGAASTISGGAGTSTSTSARDASGSVGAGVTVTGGTNSSSSATSTNAAGGTGTGSTIGGTATGTGSQDRFGTTATGGDQGRLGSTATRVGTNSSSVLPPTGRPTPTRPPFDQPNTPPITPNTPPATPNGSLNNAPQSPAVPPPSSIPAPRPPAPRSSPSTQP